MANSVKLSDVVPSRFAHLTPPDETNIERIRADLESGSKMLLNVPHAFKNENGKYELLAGHDRTEAWRRARPNEPLPIRDFSGAVNTDDAILAHFCRENLLRKDISKAAIAGEWLRKHADWSDGKIAAESGCSPEHVAGVRAEMQAAGTIQSTPNRLGVDGKTRKAPTAPRQPKKGPLGATPAKPKEKTAEERAREMVERAEAQREEAARAAERRAEKAAAQSGAEHEAPEPDRGSTGPEEATGRIQEPDSNDSPEVGAPTGARSPETQDVGTTADDADELSAGAVPPRSKSTSPSEARESVEAPVVATSDVPPAVSLDPAVVEGGAVSVVVAVLRSLPESLPTSPTTDDLLALSDDDEARLTGLSRWAQQMVAARRRARSSMAVA